MMPLNLYRFLRWSVPGADFDDEQIRDGGVRSFRAGQQRPSEMASSGADYRDRIRVEVVPTKASMVEP